MKSLDYHQYVVSGEREREGTFKTFLVVVTTRDVGILVLISYK